MSTCFSLETFTWLQTIFSRLQLDIQLSSRLQHKRKTFHSPERHLYFIDPFMQPRGVPSSFGSLKEEPLRASWPAMLVDPSWYVSIVACRNIEVNLLHVIVCLFFFLVISIQPLVLPPHTLKSNHPITSVKAIFFILLWLSMIEVANRLKSNERHLLVSSKKKW